MAVTFSAPFFAPDPTRVGVTVRVSPMPDQESRRTPDIAIPPGWKRWAWSVSGHDHPAAVRFTPMRYGFPFDEPAQGAPLRHGSVTDPLKFDYLGRVTGDITSGTFLVDVEPHML